MKDQQIKHYSMDFGVNSATYNFMEKIINQLKAEWSKPRKANHNNEETIQEFACDFSDEVADFSAGYPLKIPNDLKEFWLNAKEANLFFDVNYGQWGLYIMSPEEALLTTEREKADRPNDNENEELVIGNFLGDSDKLLIDCSLESAGRITISRPIDERKDWPIAANSFTEFLTCYMEKEGEKFWE